MPSSNYQEPIKKEDLDIEKKFQKGSGTLEAANEKGETEKKETMEIPKPAVPEVEKIPSLEKELFPEAAPEQISEKIETARKTIQTQKTEPVASIQGDAQMVGAINEHEKRVEKLVELALQKGPVHAVKVAQHLDANDDFSLDELHDRMITEDLRTQLIQKGLLKEL